MKNGKLISALAGAILALSGALVHAGDRHEHVDAHTKEGAHDHGKSDEANHGALHGGQYVEDENHHGVEMVTSENAVTFHLTEHHEPLDLEGSNFKAVVQTEAGTTILSLAIEGSAITAALGSPLPTGAKVVLSGKDGHGDTIQARFVKE